MDNLQWEIAPDFGEDVIWNMVSTNEKDYNFDKTVEELLELAEILMKKKLKKGHEKEPSDWAVVEEIGDVLIRLKVLKKIFGEENVNKRINSKMDTYRQYFKLGMYKGRI